MIGEARFFHNGMTVSDFMIQFMQQQPLTNIHLWDPQSYGYCFHSDHMLAYFMNYYHIGVPFYDMTTELANEFFRNDHLRYQYSFQPLDQCSSECSNKRDECLPITEQQQQQQQQRICHYMKPHQMKYLYNLERNATR
jgi:hypothetical protein